MHSQHENIRRFSILCSFCDLATFMGSAWYFSWLGTRRCSRLWAEAQGYHLLSRKIAGMFDWFTFAKGSGHQIYRVVVVDKTGQTLSGVVRVGKPYWWCLSVSRCPVDARWDLKTRGWPGRGSIPLRCGMSVTPRTVLWFAVADLVFAAVVLRSKCRYFSLWQWPLTRFLTVPWA